MFGVRIPGTVLMEGEPARGRAPLLADVRVVLCRSSRPPSSEDEPARWLAPIGNRVAPRGAIRFLRPLPSPACSHRAGEQLFPGE